jgi:hypothetical protein
MRVVQGLRQRLLQTESSLREAQAKRDAEAASCAAMAERLHAGARCAMRCARAAPYSRAAAEQVESAKLAQELRELRSALDRATLDARAR